MTLFSSSTIPINNLFLVECATLFFAANSYHVSPDVSCTGYTIHLAWSSPGFTPHSFADSPFLPFVSPADHSAHPLAPDPVCFGPILHYVDLLEQIRDDAQAESSKSSELCSEI